jgi:hypothetical protein
MNDERFYVRQEFFCARCGQRMEWEKRPNSDDSYMLVHGEGRCKNSGKSFYAPVSSLTPIPEEVLR